MLNNNFISIEGNIGSGKTSLVEMISRQFGYRPVYEQFEENPFLPLFYKDRQRYAFQVELAFLADRYHQLKNELPGINMFEPRLITDYIFSKSLVFAGITLSEHEYALYQNLFHIIHQQLPRPDLIVYLYVEPDRLLQNIRKRGRTYEAGIPAEYLEAVHTAYFRHFGQLVEQPVLVVDTTTIDFVTNSRHYAVLMEVVGQKYAPGITRIELRDVD